MNSESLAAALIVIAAVVVLSFLFILLRLSGRRGYRFSARGFGVSINLVTEAEAAEKIEETQENVRLSSSAQSSKIES